MTQADHPTAKVIFRVPDGEDSANVERLWAFDLGNDHYKLDNSPFFAYSVSSDDIVYAPFDRHEGFPTFQRVVSKSGNRTIRLILDPAVEGGNESDVLLQDLIHFGCSYEGMNRRYLSITIPQGVDLSAIRTYLIQRNATWEHADPSYEELFPEHA